MSLEERLKALEAEVRELRAELEQRRDGETSVRPRRCPACGCRRILHARRIADRRGGASEPLSVTVVGLFAPEPRGRFECHVCTACGRCEWYVENPAEIEVDGEAVVMLEPESAVSGGPYR